jgi:hypothetical protein
MLYLLHILLRILLGVALVATALLFASVLVVVAIATVLAICGWVWWRSRGLKNAGGVVIEGEWRVESDPRRLSK